MLTDAFRSTPIPLRLIHQHQAEYPLPELLHLFRALALLESDFPNQKHVSSVVAAIHKVLNLFPR